MINKITFKNFKIFKKKQTLEVRPITVLIGKNNSGKSAIIKLLLMLEGALKSNKPQSINLINDGFELCDKYLDLVYGKFGRAMEFQLTEKIEKTDSKNILDFHISIDTDNNVPILEYWQFNEEYKLQRNENEEYFNEVDGQDYICDFKGIKLSSYKTKKKGDLKKNENDQIIELNTDYIQ